MSFDEMPIADDIFTNQKYLEHMQADPTFKQKYCKYWQWKKNSKN